LLNVNTSTLPQTLAQRGVGEAAVLPDYPYRDDALLLWGAKATELGGSNPALFQSLELGFLYIVIEDKTLTAEFIDENGVVEFTHVTKKP